jgi:hypothetical protein
VWNWNNLYAYAAEYSMISIRFALSVIVCMYKSTDIMILLRGIQLTLVHRYWCSTVKMVFSYKIFTFYEASTLVALPNAWQRSMRALSYCYPNNNGSESTVVKTVELRWVVCHVAEPNCWHLNSERKTAVDCLFHIFLGVACLPIPAFTDAYDAYLLLLVKKYISVRATRGKSILTN